MANPLFKQHQPQNNGNPILNTLSQMKSMGPSGSLYNQMYQTNPQFRQFADSMQGKTPEQAFKENGLNFNQFKHLKW